MTGSTSPKASHKSTITGSRICRRTSCDFSPLKSTIKDSKEKSRSMQKLSTAAILCTIFMTVELIGGIKANSLAILTDAAHLLSDVAAFAVSLFSLWASSWRATPRQSYGFFRIEILGALASIQMIWLLAGILVYQATVRILHGSGEVEGSLMFSVSAFGFVVNIIMAVLLGHDHGHDHHEYKLDAEQGMTLVSDAEQRRKRNINVHSAYLHVLGDSIQSVGVMVGGAVIWCRPEWKIVDLICTLVFSVMVLATTVNTLRDVVEVLMESTPREMDAAVMEMGMCEVEGVVEVHELHVWAITVGKVLLACHVTVAPEADSERVLDELIGFVKREYDISHVTIQIERQ